MKPERDVASVDITTRLDWWEYYYGTDRPLSQRRHHPYFVDDPDGFDESAIEVDLREAATEIRALREREERLRAALYSLLEWGRPSARRTGVPRA